MLGACRRTCFGESGRDVGTGDQRNRLDRPTADRGGFPVALLGGWWWLAWLVLALGAGTAVAETASGRVVEVTEEGGAAVVLLSVGRVDGLAEDAPVTLLRQAAPIVHPLTGEVLGVPQEPVGLVQLDRVEERQARGHLVKAYTAPRIGDLAEYQRRLPAAPPTAAAQPVPVPSAPPSDHPDRVDRVIERVDDLERTLRDYRADQQGAARSGDLSQEVWDELTSMKSYLRTLDRRLAGLETLQGEDRDRLNSVVRGEFPAGETKELTIRYSPDTDVQLRVAGRTLVIEVERDSLRLVEAPVAAAAAPLPEPPPATAPSLAPVEVVPVASAPDSATEPLPAEASPAIPDEPAVLPLALPAADDSGFDLAALNSPYVQAASLGLIAALAGVLFYLMRRRESSLASEFEELERGYLDDEEEDER